MSLSHSQVLLLSPHSPILSNSDEEEHNSTKDSRGITSQFRSKLKVFSSLGILHSKIKLLFTCLKHAAILKGFRLSWSEQTGFNSEELSVVTQNCLTQTSLSLQHSVLEASIKQFHCQLDEVYGMFDSFPPLIWARGVKNYRFLFSQYSEKHQKKLSNIVPEAHLEHLFPEISFTAKENIDTNLLLLKVRTSAPVISQELPSLPSSQDKSVVVEIHLNKWLMF